MEEPINISLKVNTELKAWAKNTDRLIIDALKRAGVGVTETLLRSISYEVLQGKGDVLGGYRLTFAEYGRFRDMNVGRPRVETSNENRRRFKNRKKARFYSKVVYKRVYGNLIARLVTGYKEKIINDAKYGLKSIKA